MEIRPVGTIRRRRADRAAALKLSFASAALVALVAAAWLHGPSAAREVRGLVSRFISGRVLSRFTLRELEWREIGTGNLSARVNDDLLWKTSGLRKGQPLFETPLAEIETKLTTIPWLKSVRIQERLPSGLFIQYETHQAKAIGLRSHKPWLLSAEGHWIAPASALDLDLPVLSGFESREDAVDWLSAFERIFKEEVLQVHEVTAVRLRAGKAIKIQALVEMRYRHPVGAQAAKALVIADAAASSSRDKMFIRLKHVIQYLIKNNILVSTIDLRAGQKVVVNVGKRL